jgi:predicted Zn finger-like uncharacterized protein
MIVSCPVCHTRYLVDEAALRGQAGRTVRCANCGHTWHQAAPPELTASEDAAGRDELRIEPALEVPPRPAGIRPPLEVPPRESLQRPRRSRRSAARWWVLAVLFILAILAGVLVARGTIVAIWPAAARLYSLAGMPPEPLGAGLRIDKLAPARTPDGLIIEGNITNIGKTARAVPRLRVALHDAGEREVRFKIVDPPQPRLQPGAVAHFKTPFEHPDDAATGVVITFAAQ